MLVTLTPDFVANQLVCPPGKRRVEFVGKGEIGLYVECRESSPGVGTYYLRYKDANSKTCHQKIGSTAVITLADARARAKRLKAEITLGADPRAEAKARRAVPTFAEFFDGQYLPYVKPRKRSWDRDEELYRLRIKGVFGSKRLNQITRQQIQSFHTALSDEGLAAATANHHIKLIRYALNLAVGWGMLEANPAAKIPLLPELNHVENVVDDVELERLLHVLRTDRNKAVTRIAMLLLATGLRCGECLGLRWDDVDLERRVLVIRATRSKGKKARSIPLTDAALQVINALETRGEFEHLFINHKTKMPYTTIAKQWDRLRKTAGLPHMRLHDLRHQFASFLVNAGHSLFSVQLLLGHAQVSTTIRYSHMSRSALMEAASSASAKLTGGMAKSPT